MCQVLTQIEYKNHHKKIIGKWSQVQSQLL